MIHQLGTHEIPENGNPVPVSLPGGKIRSRIDRCLALTPHRTPRTLTCPETSPLVHSLIHKTHAEVGEFSPQLLALPLEELKSIVAFFARMASDVTKGVRYRDPLSWAGEFLHMSMTDATEYFQTASRNAYANSGRIGGILVQVAAAYAWKLRESDPDLTVPGTLRHAMKSYDEQTRQAWINTTADFMADAYDNAGAPLSAEGLATHLNNSFPSSVRGEK